MFVVGLLESLNTSIKDDARKKKGGSTESPCVWTAVVVLTAAATATPAHSLSKGSRRVCPTCA